MPCGPTSRASAFVKAMIAPLVQVDGEHAGPALVGHPARGVEGGHDRAPGRELLDLPAHARVRLGVDVGVARVVDQHVEPPARGLPERLEPPAHARRVRDVAHQRAAGDGRAEHRQVLLHGRGRRGAEVVHRHAGAGAREAERDLAPEARARAGDERDLPVQVRHGVRDTTHAASAARPP